MATISVTSELDVLDKYNSLVQQSLGSNSVYIRTKETLQEFFDNGNFKDSDKAQIISTVLNGLNGSLVNVSMSTALQWAANEKETELKKLELAKQLDALDKDILLKTAQLDKMKYDSIAVQAQTKRMYGTPTVVDGVVTSLTDDSKLYFDIEIAKQQDINLDKEGLILDSKLKESYVSIHKVVADTYTNYGAMGYTVDATGLVVTGNRTEPGYDTLSSVQKAIAKEQAKGYAYNAWANALTGTSSMLGTAIAGELTDFTGPGETLLTSSNNLSAKLGSVEPPEFSGN